MSPLRAWNRFWFNPISARPLGAFRIVFGLVMLANLAIQAFDLDYWLTSAGMLLSSEAREVAGELRYSLLFWMDDPLSVRIFVAVTAVLAVLLTLGWHTRVVSVLFYLAALSIHHRNILTVSGADTLVVIMSFYVMLAPTGAAYSLDARRAARRRGDADAPAEPLIVPWALRLIQLHLCLIYFDTAVLKCNGATWLNGTALHYVIHNTEVGRFHLSALTDYPVLINLMTVGGLLIEFALAFLLWFRPTRVWTMFAGLSLHIGILFLVNIPIFGELMTACYLTFLDPDQLDTLLRTLDPRPWLRRSERPEPALADHVEGPSPSRLPRPLAASYAAQAATEA
jgi:hypothetical protein